MRLKTNIQLQFIKTTPEHICKMGCLVQMWVDLCHLSKTRKCSTGIAFHAQRMSGGHRKGAKMTILSSIGKCTQDMKMLHLVKPWQGNMGIWSWRWPSAEVIEIISTDSSRCKLACVGLNLTFMDKRLLPLPNGEGYVYISVCLSATLRKNAQTDFQTIFRIGPARNKKHSSLLLCRLLRAWLECFAFLPSEWRIYASVI